MATMKDIITSPLLLAMVIIGLLYIVGFSLVYLKKAYTHCLELGISKEDLKNVIKSSLVFSIVPSLSIVVGLFALISVLGTVWSWWRLSVIGSLSYESLISSSVASAIGFSSSAEMLEGATGQQFGVVMILMSIGMLSGFFILLPLGKKLSMSVSKSEENGNGWKYVLSGCFMLCLFAVYIPVLLIGDTVQAAVMLTGLVIAVGLGLLAKNPKLAWLNDFIMAFSMIGGMISSVLWCKLFYSIFADWRYLMKKKGSNKIVITDSFQAWAHKWGRIGTLIALLYMIAIPFVVLTFYDSLPSIGEVINLSTISILMIYIPVGFSEAISYTPILGASSYLTFITGNIMNLKLPCAVNAMKLAKKEPNTPEGEAISSVAVAICSIMTIIILALAALLSAWISPVFELPAVKTASNYLIPALFGSLTLGLFASTSSGKKVVKNGVMGVVPVIAIITVLALVVRITTGSSLFGMVGFLILFMLPVAIISSRIMWKKNIIKVIDKEDADTEKSE